MSVRRQLDDLAQVLAELPPPTTGWTEELWELYEKTEGEPDLPLTDAQRQRFAAHRTWEKLTGRAHGLFRSVRGGLESDPSLPAGEVARAAELAESWVRTAPVVSDAVWLLYDVGAPHGEAALLRLVGDDSVDEYARFLARERLLRLRRACYQARAAEPVGDDEEPLLPEPARRWVSGLPAAPESFAQVRALLLSLLPNDRLNFPEPPPEWDGDYDEDWDERPQWLDIRNVVRDLMPSPRLVTRQRMAEARRECELLGLDADDEDFTERWTARIAAWLAEDVFDWLVDHSAGALEAAAPWAADLAESYVRRGFGAGSAVRLLWAVDELPGSREALDRIAADQSVPPEIREQARR
ncbi:hypothetical protein ACFU5O_08745 [Streptomyces sp. NPDC057445]|uniref:hypothetical protein n=1 Tax=Streptomyces sp. NPDC057445 TaxID=3346136 RepID=UPI0036B00404